MTFDMTSWLKDSRSPRSSAWSVILPAFRAARSCPCPGPPALLGPAGCAFLNMCSTRRSPVPIWIRVLNEIADVILRPIRTVAGLCHGMPSRRRRSFMTPTTIRGDCSLSPRAVLKRVLGLFEDAGLAPVVAPELEFFLVEQSADANAPLVTPTGKSGRPEKARQAYGIDAVNEFGPLFEDIYDYCDVQKIDIDTLSHEAGAAQMEINFNHGAAPELGPGLPVRGRSGRRP